MSDEITKQQHSSRIHKTKVHEKYEDINHIKHSHHTHNPRKIIKEETIQENVLNN